MLGGFLDNQEGCASNNPLGKKFFQMVYMKRVKVSKEDYRILSFRLDDTYTLYDLGMIFDFAAAKARTMHHLGMERYYEIYDNGEYRFILSIELE